LSLSWHNSIFSFIGYRNLLNIFKFSTNSEKKRLKASPDGRHADGDEGASRINGTTTQTHFTTNIFSEQILTDVGADDKIPTA
jgi:hypothetical protein